MATNPIINTLSGKLEGVWQAKNTIAVFKGVPFAKPPVGDLRWRAPQAVEPWEGVKKADQFGSFAWQQGTFIEGFLEALIQSQGWSKVKKIFIKGILKIAPKPKQSEDCLYLNVRTPSIEANAKLPVMVWIHGGDHQDGGGAEDFYDSNAIPERGVVTVTINYRLGLMGYFTHPELSQESEHTISGNYGTLDQIAALEWVKDNIASFGGDPENVTIFGESAGGESVAHMLSSPLAKGLFHKAILQSPANSGQMMHLSTPFLDYPSGENRGLSFAAKAGIVGENQLEQLRKMPAKQLQELVKDGAELSNFYPIIDGHVIPNSPFEIFQEGRQHSVPVLLGSNADEGTLIHALMLTPSVEYRFRPMESNKLPSIFYEIYKDEAEQLFKLYPGLERRNDKAEKDFLGDDMFGAKARFYAEKIADSNQPAYLYFFKRTPPSSSQTAGAFHAAELAFVHGKSNPLLPLDKADLKLSDTMISYWTQFAKTGNPNENDQAEWSPFDPAQPKWMSFGKNKVGMETVEREQKYQLLMARMNRQIQEMKNLRIS